MSRPKSNRIIPSMPAKPEMISANFKGSPAPLAHTLLVAPQSRMDILSPVEIQTTINASSLIKKYNEEIDRESAYEMLSKKLEASEKAAEKEKQMPLIFEEVKLDCGYRIDILVLNKLVIEIKSVEALNDIYLAQILTYMKLGNYKLGLLINFNVLFLKDGIKRVVNGL